MQIDDVNIHVYYDVELARNKVTTDSNADNIDSIKISNVENICNRNAQKRENINTLSTNTSSICNDIPYKVYYMSCNLDHVLYNLQNANNKEKGENTLEFSERYI